MSAANHVRVSQAALLFRHSFQLITPAGSTAGHGTARRTAQHSQGLGYMSFVLRYTALLPVVPGGVETVRASDTDN